MKLIRTSEEMQELSLGFLRRGIRTALVPTMGALHEGHLSLIRKAKEICDYTILSIFVNPTQFGPGEDLSKYPRPFDADCALAGKCGCDAVFAPAPEDIYPPEFRTFVEVNELGSRLCGITRPIHFRGVTTVVLKLFNICMPTAAVFGQKDAQQVIIIKKMVKDLNLTVNVVTAPTVRERDGLAMSSRNVYLTANERREAPLINEVLKEAERMYLNGERDALKIIAEITGSYNRAKFFKTEYVETVNAQNLEPVEKISGTSLVAVAVRTQESKTRLIDNIVLGGSI
jgi:pantoate--beta-alanine ligase